MSESKANTAQNFKDLLVWQKAMVLAKSVSQITKAFPAEERFGLVAQMREQPFRFLLTLLKGKRAIQLENSFIQFISHAEGLLAELETQLQLSTELGFC